MKKETKIEGLELYVGDCIESMKTMPDQSVQTCVTSPPYFGLRDYGQDGQIGLEQTPDEYVARLVEVFREVRRVLRDDGTLWLNLGDSYAATGGKAQPHRDSAGGIGNKGTRGEQGYHAAGGGFIRPHTARDGLKPKDLIGIPWRVALALQADGWYLRQDIIWCLSGGTRVYARTQKGEMPTTIKDLARLDPATVQLWNGEKWTQLLGISNSERNGDEIEIVLRSGERISCTPTHRFPTSRGIIDAGSIEPGDLIESTTLPEPEKVKDCAIDTDAAWFAGLYLAEGSRSGSALQIAGHTKETERWESVKRIAAKYGGSATRTVDGNNMNIRVYGRFLHAIVDELVSGRTAWDKGFSPVVWKYSNVFISAMVDGYLSGDAQKEGNRYRLGFCRNYNLEASLRTACARLGYSLTLNMTSTPYNGENRPTFRGEMRKTVSTHHNNKSRSEVVEIRKARSRQFYDIGVADDPHLFALASGVLTHNSKPNPMPESVRDRCTKSHEYVFLLSKSPSYYYDKMSIMEPAKYGEQHAKKATSWGTNRKHPNKANVLDYAYKGDNHTTSKMADGSYGRNRRSVWTVSTKPFKGAHFAVFPPDLIEPCVLAGCPEGGTVLDPFGGSGTTAGVALKHGRKSIICELSPDYAKMVPDRIKSIHPSYNTKTIFD